MNKQIIVSCPATSITKNFDADIIKNQCKMISDMFEEIELNDENNIIMLPESIHWSKCEFEFLSAYLRNRKHKELPTISKPLYEPLQSILPVCDYTLLEQIEDKCQLESFVNMANYLQCDGMLSMLCAYIAELITKMSNEQILEFFDLEDDLTAEEKQTIIEENDWFEKDYYHEM